MPGNSRAQGKSRQLRGPVCAKFGARAGKTKRPAPERLPSSRRRLWEPWRRVPGTPTWTGEYPQKSPFISNVQDLFWCDARDEQGRLLHAPNCNQRDCFVVQTKKQETNTGGKAKLPDHYRCTITCALCGKRKHYEDECYHKLRLSAKLKTENGSGTGSGKGNADKASGKGRSKGNGKGQGGKGKGGRGGSDPKPDKDKNADQSGGNLNTTRGGNSAPSGGQSNTGPTTRSQTKAQHKQGTEHTNEDGDQSDTRKRSRFMRMARKLQKKGFEVTCPAGF